MGKRFVDSKALRSGFIIVFITVSWPQIFTSKHVGKYSMYRRIRDKDTPTNSHQTPSEKVQEARVVGFQHHREILGIRVSFFPPVAGYVFRKTFGIFRDTTFCV